MKRVMLSALGIIMLFLLPAAPASADRHQDRDDAYWYQRGYQEEYQNGSWHHWHHRCRRCIIMINGIATITTGARFKACSVSCSSVPSHPVRSELCRLNGERASAFEETAEIASAQRRIS